MLFLLQFYIAANRPSLTKHLSNVPYSWFSRHVYSSYYVTSRASYGSMLRFDHCHRQINFEEIACSATPALILAGFCSYTIKSL